MIEVKERAADLEITEVVRAMESDNSAGKLCRKPKWIASQVTFLTKANQSMRDSSHCFFIGAFRRSDVQINIAGKIET